MSDQDALERIMASLYDAMLDDTQWPATSALIDETCGIKGNTLLVGEGPKDASGPPLSGSTTGESGARTWSVNTLRSTTLWTKACRVFGNCPTAA